MSLDELTKTPEETVEKAKELDMECIFPGDGELLLDIVEPYLTYKNITSPRMEMMLETNGITILGRLVTRSTHGNSHLYLWISEPITQPEAIALQACLGSDLKREMLSLLRYRKNATPVALFETPDQAKLVHEWRKKR